MFHFQLLFHENRAVYEIMWKNIVEPDKPHICRMRFACWITKVTDTHSKYVMFIAFPLQEMLYERASLLPYMYIVLFVMLCVTYCLVCL
jgi:hypothetical protein